MINDECRIMESCHFLFFKRKSEAIHLFVIRHSSFDIYELGKYGVS